MLRTRRRLACGPGFIASSLALSLAAAAPLPASAQSAESTSSSGGAPVPLPPVVVETSQAKPKSVKKAKTAKKAAPVATQQVPVSPSTTQGPGGQRGERANGPVTGYLATQSATGTKTDTLILETPQSISVVTKDQITAQQAQTVRDALAYTPGVSIDSYGASAFFDWIKIRGFNAPQYLDGLLLPNDSSAFAVPRIEPYGLERIEVLKGPSSGLYGQSNPGGLINMVSKRPLWDEHYEMQGTIGSFDRKEAAFDVGGPVSHEFAYRLVALGRISDAEIDYTEDNKLFIAPSLAWRPTKDTTITVLSQYQRIQNDGYQQYVPGQATLLPNPFGHIPQSRYLGEPGFDNYTLEHASIGYALEHRFNRSLQFRQNLRYMDVSNDMQAMRGDFMLDPFTFQPSYDTLIRAPIYVDADARNFTVDNQLQADLSTGPLDHTLLVGLDYQKTVSSNESRLPSSLLQYLPINVFNPVYGAYPIPSADALSPFLDLHTRQEQTGIYVQDQIKLDRFTLSLTGRQDWSSVETVSSGVYPPSALSPYERDDSARTGRVGLSYLFDFGLSPYVNYSTSFTPNIGASATGGSFKPTTGEGKEIGIKYMMPGTNLMFTAALFDIVQNDILTTDPNDLSGLLSVQTDQARVRGFEFEVRGNVTRELEIVGGYSKLDPEITKSAIASNVGNYMPNVNLETASLWAQYTCYDGPAAGLGVGGGVRYVGENYGDAANAIYIPSHTLLDASISYDLGYLSRDLKGWQAQVNGSNLTDEYYVSSCQGSILYCGLGAGRTVLGTLRYSWDAGLR